LSDAFLGTGAEPWKIPDVADLPLIGVDNATDPKTFQPYKRDPETLARMWAIPGTKGLEHRIGGLEKADITGNVSYDPENHHQMPTGADSSAQPGSALYARPVALPHRRGGPEQGPRQAVPNQRD